MCQINEFTANSLPSLGPRILIRKMWTPALMSLYIS